jgi:hypothetical protein
MAKDEQYVIGLCDRVLGLKAERQRKFPFLVGDPDHLGRCRALLVDAYYEKHKLVVEYRERQHSEPVSIMDRRWCAVSGCSRAEQRRRYDQRRREVLPLNGVRLLELDYTMFAHDRRKRLLRNAALDERVIRSRLDALLSD